MSNGLFEMTDRDFWEDPNKCYDGIRERTVLEDKPGFFVDAPRVADIDGPPSIPVPIFYALQAKDAWGVELVRDAVIVASRLEDRGCWAMTVAYRTGDSDKSLPGPKDLLRPTGPPPDPERIQEKFIVTDLRQSPMIPWERGTYETRVFVRDQLSNPVRTSIQDAPKAFEDPAVAQFLAAQRAPAGVPKPVQPPPAQPLPSYAKRDDSPPVPEKAGLAFQVPRVLVVQPDAVALLRLSFRLPVLRGDHVPPAPPRPTAIVPVHLVLTGSEQPEPLLLTLRVPVWTPVDAAAEANEATGHATLDLFQLYRPLNKMKPQTFFIYAISGEVFSGPQLMALVGKDQLRR